MFLGTVRMGKLRPSWELVVSDLEGPSLWLWPLKMRRLLDDLDPRPYLGFQTSFIRSFLICKWG